MNYDIAIVGAGIAGASLAAEIGTQARVLLLEAEDQPGYHATGRSAAFWSETYGGAAIQPLTTASGGSLRDGGYLEPLGSLHIGRDADAAAIDALQAEFAGTPVVLDRVDPSTLVPGLRPAWRHGVMEASCAYIDVGRLHADRLRLQERTAHWRAILAHVDLWSGEARRRGRGDVMGLLEAERTRTSEDLERTREGL